MVFVMPGIPTTLDVGITPDGTSDNTAELQTFLNQNAGRIVLISSSSAPYIAGRLLPRSNTTILIDPGVVIHGRQMAPDNNNIFRLENVQNVVIKGYGASLFRGPNSASSAVYLASASDCLIAGLTIEESLLNTNGSKDCVYVGAAGVGGFSQNITISDVIGVNARRNCVSIVAGQGILLDRCHLSGAYGAPGAGVDIEANRYGVNQGITLRDCVVSGNENAGVAIVFGDRIRIDNLTATDNGGPGLSAGQSGAALKYDLLRPNIDSHAVSSWDLASGNIALSGMGNLRVGMWGQFVARPGSGATVPAEVQVQTRWMIAEVGGATIKLSRDVVSVVDSFSDSGTGTLTNDPTTSDIVFAVYVEDGASNLTIEGGHFKGNGDQAEIDLGPSVNCLVRGARIHAGLDRTACRARYARGVTLSDLICSGDPASTDFLARGLHIGACTDVRARDCRIEDAAYYGIYESSVLNLERRGETLIGCGNAPGGSPIFSLNLKDREPS